MRVVRSCRRGNISPLLQCSNICSLGWHEMTHLYLWLWLPPCPASPLHHQYYHKGPLRLDTLSPSTNCLNLAPLLTRCWSKFSSDNLPIVYSFAVKSRMYWISSWTFCPVVSKQVQRPLWFPAKKQFKERTSRGGLVHLPHLLLIVLIVNPDLQLCKTKKYRLLVNDVCFVYCMTAFGNCCFVECTQPQ